MLVSIRPGEVVSVYGQSYVNWKAENLRITRLDFFTSNETHFLQGTGTEQKNALHEKAEKLNERLILEFFRFLGCYTAQFGLEATFREYKLIPSLTPENWNDR